MHHQDTAEPIFGSAGNRTMLKNVIAATATMRASAVALRDSVPALAGACAALRPCARVHPRRQVRMHRRQTRAIHSHFPTFAFREIPSRGNHTATPPDCGTGMRLASLREKASPEAGLFIHRGCSSKTSHSPTAAKSRSAPQRVPRQKLPRRAAPSCFPESRAPACAPATGLADPCR